MVIQQRYYLRAIAVLSFGDKLLLVVAIAHGGELRFEAGEQGREV
jgi:hypothetical protein